MGLNNSRLLFLGLQGVICIFLIGGCAYSFSGAAVAPDVNTIRITLLQNNAPVVQATLAQTLTEALRDKFLTQSKLKLSDINPDLELGGSIIDYSVIPITLQANNTAAGSRLTITLKIKFDNNKYPKESWEKTFTQYADFSASQTLASVESGLIAEIDDKLTQDIFNKALANW